MVWNLFSNMYIFRIITAALLRIMYMKDKNLKILVASHKPDRVYHDDVYTPIHVGRAISKFKNEMADMIGDDTGDNISSKNGEFCELTAIYWAWKNLKDADYIGLAHYRRYFETKFTSANIEDVFKTHDVILAKPYLHDRYNEMKMARTLDMEDEVIFLKVFKRLFPEYEQTLINYMYGFKDYSYDMFVMKTATFNDSCSFLFSILFECDKLMKPLPYTCSSRRLGYIAEYLLPIYCFHHKLRIRTEPVVSFIGESGDSSNNFKQMLKIEVLKKIYDKHKPKSIEDMCLQSVLIGLKNDGIKFD